MLACHARCAACHKVDRHPVAILVLDFQRFQRIATRVHRDAARSAGVTTARAPTQGRLPDDAVIAFCTSDVHRRHGVRHQVDDDGGRADVAVRVGDGVVESDHAFFARCRGVREGAIAVVNNAALSLSIQAASHQRNTCSCVNAVCTLGVVAQCVNNDCSVFCRLTRCVVHCHRHVVHDLNRQRSIGRATVAVGHHHREVVGFRHVVHIGGRAGQGVDVAVHAVGNRHHQAAVCAGDCAASGHIHAIDLDGAQCVVAQADAQRAAGGCACAFGRAAHQTRFQHLAAIAFCTNDVHRRLGVRHQGNGDSGRAAVAVRVGDGVVEGDRAFLAVTRLIGEGAVFVVDQRAGGRRVAVLRLGMRDTRHKIDAVSALGVVAQRIDRYGGVFCLLRESVVFSLWHVVLDGDRDVAAACAAARTSHHHIDDVGDLRVLVQGLVVCLRFAERVFVADRTCLVIDAGDIARDFEDSPAGVDHRQQGHITLELRQGKGDTANRDGADAIIGTHGNVASGGFRGGGIAQTCFIDGLCIRYHAGLGRGLFIFSSNGATRNEVLGRTANRTRIFQRQGRGVFNHVGQAHIGAAGTVTTSQDGGGGVQLCQGVLPLVQGGDQRIDVGVCQIGDGGFAGICGLEQVVCQLELLAFCNLQAAGFIALQGKLAASGRDDFCVNRYAHAHAQGLQAAVSVTNPSLSFQLGDQCRSICHDMTPRNYLSTPQTPLRRSWRQY